MRQLEKELRRELDQVQAQLDCDTSDVSIKVEEQHQEELYELILQEKAKTQADRQMQDAEMAEVHAKIDHANQAAELHKMQAKRADEQAFQLSSALAPTNARQQPRAHRGVSRYIWRN